MAVFGFVLAVIFAFWLGFYLKTLNEATKLVKPFIEAKKKPEEPTATIIDGDDVIQMAMLEEKERLRKLNPDA